MPPETTDPVHMTPHKKSRLWMILAILAALLSVGLGIALWYALVQKQPVTDPLIGNQQPASQTEKLSATFALASPSHKPGTLVDQFNFSFTAPKTWRTVDTSRDIDNPATDPLIEAENQMLLELTMVPEDSAGTGNEILATNTLRLRDISNWLRASNEDSTAEQRQKAFDYIMAQGNKDVTPVQKSGDTNGLLDINRGLIGGPFLHAKGIATTDGMLKGVVYLTIGTDAIGYSPAAIAVMAGTLNGKQVLLTAHFDIYDELYKKFAANPVEGDIRKAQEAFKQGKVPDEAGKYYQNIVDAMSGIEVKKK